MGGGGGSARYRTRVVFCCAHIMNILARSLKNIYIYNSGVKEAVLIYTHQLGMINVTAATGKKNLVQLQFLSRFTVHTF